MSEENIPLENENEHRSSLDPNHSTDDRQEDNPSEKETLRIDPSIMEIANAYDRLRGEMRKVIIGQDNLMEELFITLLCDGHALIEGVPGIAKTMTAKLFARILNVDFSRIQFTPDLMPADVLGTNVFNMKESSFEFKEGPIFSNVVLIDEINRAPAKTQSSLFEVMEERQITIDGQRRRMEGPFLVLATQNPVEQEGTYKLPEAQLDRFFFRIMVDYPSLEEEMQILSRFKEDFTQKVQEEVIPVIDRTDLETFRKTVERVRISDDLIKYIAQLIHTTRQSPDLFLGASPRASLAIMKAAKAYATLQGREFVTPDDIKRVVYPVLNHRLLLSPEREMEGVTLREILDAQIQTIEIPR